MSVPIGGREFRGDRELRARVRPSGDERAGSGSILGRLQRRSVREEIVVYFDGRLRDIRKFESADALKAQLKIDLEKIR